MMLCYSPWCLDHIPGRVIAVWRPIVRFRYCFRVASLALCVHAVAAQAQSDDVDPPSQEVVAEHRNQSDSTAEEILRTLQRIRPQGELIRSARMLQRGEVKTKKKLYPEGARLISQIGHIRKESKWWHFEFEEDGQPISLKMLPNATLEAVVRSARGHEPSMRFVISGQLTVFQDENYFFPRIATRSVVKPIAAAEPTAKAKAKATPTPSPIPAKPGTPVSADDVLAKIREQQPNEQILPRHAKTAQQPFNKPPPTAYLQDGAPLIRRPGRLVSRGDWLTFVFESDTQDYPELPLKLLPNQAVELMQHTTQQDTEGVVFIVSGEITAFMGENYLLPHIALRRVDVGNLTK